MSSCGSVQLSRNGEAAESRVGLAGEQEGTAEYSSHTPFFPRNAAVSHGLCGSQKPLFAKSAFQKCNRTGPKIKAESKLRAGAGTGKLEGRLMVAEKRKTGSVSWRGTSSPI